jgi:hypothetical protein
MSTIPRPPTSGGENQKLARASFSSPPRLSTQDLRRYSPLSLAEQTRVEAALGRLDPDQITPERVQRVVDALSGSYDQMQKVAVAGWVQFGRWLLALNAKVPYGMWTSLFRGSRTPIASPLPFNIQVAQAYMRIADHPDLGNPKNWRRLPTANWRTMDELTRLAKTQNLQALINRGTVHQHITVREVRALARGGKDGPFAETAAQRTRTKADPLTDIRRAIHFYAGPSTVLVAYLRETLAELETDDDEDTEERES